MYLKTDKFPGIEQSSVFYGYYDYARCFSNYQLLISNIISTLLISKNSGNESFCVINWIRHVSYSNSLENDFQRDYIVEKFEIMLML